MYSVSKKFPTCFRKRLNFQIQEGVQIQKIIVFRNTWTTFFSDFLKRWCLFAIVIDIIGTLWCTLIYLFQWRPGWHLHSISTDNNKKTYGFLIFIYLFLLGSTLTFHVLVIHHRGISLLQPRWRMVVKTNSKFVNESFF